MHDLDDVPDLVVKKPASVLATTPGRSAAFKWWVVLMLWVVCFLNYADRQSVFSVFPKLKEEFGFTKIQLGLIGSAFMWVYAFGAPFAGFIGDRVRRKDLILGGCLFWSAVTVTTGWCRTLWQFVTVRALEGFGETFYFPASMSLLSDYHGRRTRSRAMSIHQSSVYLGTVAGSWLGAWFAEHHGWRTGFYVFGGVGVVVALILFRFLREPERGEAEKHDKSNLIDETWNEPPMTWREILATLARNPTALVLMVVFLGANFVAMIVLTWTPTFLVEKFHFQLTAAGLSGSAFIHLASAVSVPLGGLLADRFARRMAGGRMLVQAVGLLGGSGAIFLVGSTASVVTLLWVMTIFGLCKGLYDSNIFASLFDLIEPRARATVAGLMNTVGWGGGALGPLFVGWTALHGKHATEIENMSDAIASCGAIYLAGAILLGVAIMALARHDSKGRPGVGNPA